LGEGLGRPCRPGVRGGGGGGEAFPGQNVSGKGPRRAVRQMRVRIYVFKVRRREKTRLKSALSENPVTFDG
jgi:hypothetical protein